MSDIHDKIDEISSFLKDDPNLIELKRINDEMEDNEEVILLSQELNKIEREYSSLLNHVDENSPEAKEMQKKLFVAKRNLDEHPLVQEYYHFLSLVNEPLRYLEFNLINRITKPYKNSSCK